MRQAAMMDASLLGTLTDVNRFPLLKQQFQALVDLEVDLQQNRAFVEVGYHRLKSGLRWSLRLICIYLAPPPD